jgi:hypothetical protein
MKKFFWLSVLAAVILAAMFTGCATPAASSSGTGTAATASSATTGGTMLWGFESKSTEGWNGKGKWADANQVNEDPKFVTEGKYSLKIDAKGSTGWNQNIAINDGPFSTDLPKFTSITMDVYVPHETIKDMDYAQIFLVMSGSANAWYQVQGFLKEGLNKLTYKLDNSQTGGDMWHMYLVFNSGKPFGGPIYIDNVQGH